MREQHHIKSGIQADIQKVVGTEGSDSTQDYKDKQCADVGRDLFHFKESLEEVRMFLFKLFDSVLTT